MQEYSSRDGVDWGTSHRFLANMGGWYLKFGGIWLCQREEWQRDRRRLRELPKPVGAREEQDEIMTIRRAITMPNPLSRSTMLKGQFKHMDTEEPAEIRTIMRAVTVPNPISQSTMLKGQYFSSGNPPPPRRRPLDAKRASHCHRATSPNSRIRRAVFVFKGIV
jgi:hypothetical protein